MITPTTKSRALLTLLGAAAALALAPALAQADPYVVDHCKNWDTDAPGTAFEHFTGVTANQCGSGGSLRRQIFGIPSMEPGGALHMELLIPDDRPNIVIERVQASYGSEVTWSGSTPFLVAFNHLGQHIRVDSPPVAAVLDSVLPPNARKVTWALACATDAAPAGCSYSHGFVMDVHKTRLFLNESVAPTLTVDGGTLTTPGPKTGVQSVALHAADTDSGVRGVTVRLGTTIVGGVEYPCAFADWSACRRDRADQVIQADTTKVPDGAYEMLVTARDTAGNEVTRSAGTVTVANGPTAGAPNGAGASRLAKLSARFATTSARTRRLRYGSRPTIRGRLVDERGNAIAGAQIAVLQRARRAGAARSQVAAVQTGADGRFSHRLRGGPSRTITFAYSAFGGDREPAATANLRTTVRAVVSARITPRSVRAGREVTMRGRLALLGRPGVEIKIQARDGRRWRTIDDVRTTARGAFAWRYRFKASGAGKTFAFRARVASPIYAFASASSEPIRVRVR